MWAQITSYLPWVSLIAGLTGSLHCVSMCGGLVAFSARSKADIFRYQLGRLFSYLLLGLFAGFVGQLIHLEKNSPKASLIPGLILGCLFLYWGIETLRGKRTEIPLPPFLAKTYSRLFKSLVSDRPSPYRSLYVGMLSIFLPCGILYSVVLTVASFETKWWSLFSMLFFWIGTLPAMILAPSILSQIMNPLRSKVPKIYASILIIIGLGTISFRVTKFQHQITHPDQAILKPTDQLNCH